MLIRRMAVLRRRIKDSILGLLPALFPWIPAEVVTVISLGLFAVLLAGIVKKVRGK